MPRGSKANYSRKRKDSAGRVWAPISKETGGGKKLGSGRGKHGSRAASRKGGRKNGRSPAMQRRGGRA
jgi:hypothetical protein